MAFAKSSNYLLIGMFLIDTGVFADPIESLTHVLVR